MWCKRNQLSNFAESRQIQITVRVYSGAITRMSIPISTSQYHVYFGE